MFVSVVSDESALRGTSTAVGHVGEFLIGVVQAIFKRIGHGDELDRAAFRGDRIEAAPLPRLPHPTRATWIKPLPSMLTVGILNPGRSEAAARPPVISMNSRREGNGVFSVLMGYCRLLVDSIRSGANGLMPSSSS